MESTDGWKEKAKGYYRDGLSFVDMEALLEVSRKTISSYIKGLPEYEQLRAARQKERSGRRREYKTEKQRQYRQQASPSIYAITEETIRREHELAVMELSRERYHG